MITKPEERKTELRKIEQGTMTVEHLLTTEQMDGKCRMVAKVVMPTGGKLKYHPHFNESETYYILSGNGIYNDDGIEYPVTAGDLTFTPSGHSHGISNPSKEDLVFLAIIIKGEQ